MCLGTGDGCTGSPQPLILRQKETFWEVFKKKWTGLLLGLTHVEMCDNLWTYREDSQEKEVISLSCPQYKTTRMRDIHAQSRSL